MKKLNYILYVTLIYSIVQLSACKKQDQWLSKKPIKSTAVPETLADFQAIMDVSEITCKRYPTAGLMGTDNILLKAEDFDALDEVSQNLYIWKKEIWSGASSPQWRDQYMLIEYANIVLEGLKNIKNENNAYQNIKGQASFHRAAAMYNLAILFAKAYAENTAQTDLGIPVRLSADVNTLQPRATLATTFQQILTDATAAAELLDQSQPYLQRPTKAAAFALLARTYLYMGDYQHAKNSASSAITLHPALLDFNNANLVDPNADYRFPYLAKGNPEVLFYAESLQYYALWPDASSTGLVNPTLYNSYTDDDLRKTVYYELNSSGAQCRGSYTGSYSNFCGLGSNEVYLTRAECNARLNDPEAALKDLNYLLINRYKSGHFKPEKADNNSQILLKILVERNKELPFCGDIRWADLKRLNLEPAYQRTLIRSLNNLTFRLAPNDKRYVLPIPDDELNFSAITPNER